MKCGNDVDRCCIYAIDCPLLDRNELSVDELLRLAKCTINLRFGCGARRKSILGRWYPIVQGLVNYISV